MKRERVPLVIVPASVGLMLALVIIAVRHDPTPRAVAEPTLPPPKKADPVPPAPVIPPAPVTPDLVLPDDPVPPPVPPPTPPPQGPQALAADEVYLLGSLTDKDVVASPAGLVTVQPLPTGTVVVSKFVGSKNAVEEHTASMPLNWLIRPVPGASGQVEVVITKIQPNAGNGWVPGKRIRRTLLVGGAAPPSPATDPLAAPLAAAYAAETDHAKANKVKSMATVYAAAVTTTVPTDGPTLAVLLADVHKAMTPFVPEGQLPKVRAVIAAELAAQLGPATATLDAPLRAKVGAQLTRMAGLLTALAQ